MRFVFLSFSALNPLSRVCRLIVFVASDITDSFSEAVRELIERFFEEGWLPDMICDLGCGGASVFEIKPTNFEYPPEGGEQILEIIVGKSDKWTITQAE